MDKIDNKHHIAITGIIIKDGKYLITKRSNEKRLFPGMWTVPGGNLEMVDYFNDEKDTSSHWYNVAEKVLRREIMEEVGLTIKNIKYLTNMTMIAGDSPLMIFSLYCDHHEGDVVLNEESVDHKWVSLEEAREHDLIEGIYDELVMLDKILKGNEVEEWQKVSDLVIDDVVYDRFEIKEDVLIELINSKPMQRLKGVSQFGMPDDYYYKNGFSRYEHSIGVFLLLKKLGASLEEQIAGLLYDVSHTAFSHVIDRIFGDPEKEDYQDNNHLNIIETTEIKNILDKYEYNYKKIADIESLSLLETEIPSLCADRIDYSLRELHYEGIDVGDLVNDLDSFNGQIIFNNTNIAFRFAELFLKLQNEHWAGKQAVIRYEILGGVLKRALDLGILNENDFYKQDREILGLLEDCEDDLIKDELNILKGNIAIDFTDWEGILLRKKFRYIDPEVLIGNKIIKLSQLSEEYGDILDNERKNSMIERRVVYNKI